MFVKDEIKAFSANAIRNYTVTRGAPNYIKQISMDMSKSYKSGPKIYFSSAEVIFDKFHIKKALKEAVDKVRKVEVASNERLKKTKIYGCKMKKISTRNRRNA